MRRAAAGLGNRAHQPRAVNFAGLELQSRRQHAYHLDAELRARQIDRIGGDIACLQPLQNMLQA